MAELSVLGLLRLALFREGKSFADLGWARPLPFRALAAAVGIALAYSGLTLSSPAFGANLGEVSLFRAWGMAVGVAGGLVEELVFRGFVMAELEGAGVPPAGRAVVSALFFSLIHGGYGLLLGQFYLLTGIGFTFVLGLGLAWVYFYGHRSLSGPVLAHCLINALIEPWLMLGFVGFARR